MLDVWPAFPIIILSYDGSLTGSVDNIIAALECTDRVCQITFMNVRNLDLDIFGTMQQSFPELTYLQLWSSDKTAAVVPDSFLGGSAPRLEFLALGSIPFPGLPKLLLSATHLVRLHLYGIPHSGYISPDGMVAALSTLTSLGSLWLRFESPRSCPDQASRRPFPKTRSVLPVLTYFEFKGVTEYLDDLVACIDAPQLNGLSVVFSNDVIFDTPQLVRFISHTPIPKTLKNVYITLKNGAASVRFSSQTPLGRELDVGILCRGLDWQVSFLEQVFTSCLPPLNMLEDLYFHDSEYSRSPPESDWKDSIENRQWPELFRSFIAVKNLYLSKEFASSIAPALQELVEGRTTDVLPALQNIFLKGLDSSGSFQESIGQLVAARQVANRPIGIFPWTESEEGRGLG